MAAVGGHRESGCITAYSGRASARARVREQHPWGVGGHDAITPRVAHCAYIASTAQAEACQGHASERPAEPAGGPGPGPGRPGPGPGGARRDAKNAAGAEPPSSCIARGGCVAPAGRCGLVADPLDEQRQFRMARRTSRCNRGWRMGGRDARVARGRARLAAIATRWMRPTQVARPAHIPPSAVSGGRGFATRERHGDVLGSLRSRRADCGAHKWRARRTYRRRP